MATTREDPLHSRVFELMKELAPDDFQNLEAKPELKDFLIKYTEDSQRSRDELADALKSVEEEPQPVATALAKLLPENDLEKLRNAAAVASWDADIDAEDNKFLIGASSKGMMLQSPEEMPEESRESSKLIQVAGILYEAAIKMLKVYGIDVENMPGFKHIEWLVKKLKDSKGIIEMVNNFVRAWNAAKSISAKAKAFLGLMVNFVGPYKKLFMEMVAKLTEMSWDERFVFFYKLAGFIYHYLHNTEEEMPVELMKLIYSFSEPSQFTAKIAKYSHFLQLSV